MSGRCARLLRLGIVLGLLAGSAGVATGAPFRQAPPTTGVHRATAYTLRGGEWQIGTGVAFALRPQGYLWSSLSLDYGIANWFQVGIAASHDVQEGPPSAYMTFASLVKLRMSLGSGLDLAFPLGVGFVDRRGGIEFGYFQGGAVACVRLGALAAHGGADLGAVKGGGWYLHPYAVVDYDALPTVKFVAELGVFPLSVGVGAWLRLLDFLDLKLALAPLALSITGGVYLRF